MSEEQRNGLREEIRRKLEEIQQREARLLSAEKTVKLLAAGYAVYAGAAAILSLIYPTNGFHALSVMLTVMLSMITVVLCTQKYESRAQRMKGDCAVLMRLMREAEAGETAAVERELTGLLALSEAMGEHERRAVLRQRGQAEGVRMLRGYEKFLFWFVEIAGMTLLAAALLLPAAGIVLAACGVI